MIKATDLTKYYGENTALDRVSFDVEAGECVGFLGRNGAGKTTVLKILSTALLPSGGTATIEGHDVVEEPDSVRRLIGFLPEEPPLYREMNPRGYLRFLGQLRGIPEANIERRIDEVAEQVGFSDVLDKPIQTLSLGYRKRVGIAQAILHDPKLLIVDEPISGLDPVQIVEIRELLRTLRGQHTILLSSHILTELSQTCDRFLVIDRGRIVGRGREDDLVRAAATEATRFIVEVTVVGDKAQVTQALESVEAHTSHKFMSEGEILHVQVELSSDAPDEVAAKLVGAGLKLRSLTGRAADLESIFVSLTGKEAA